MVGDLIYHFHQPIPAIFALTVPEIITAYELAAEYAERTRPKS